MIIGPPPKFHGTRDILGTGPRADRDRPLLAARRQGAGVVQGWPPGSLRDRGRRSLDRTGQGQQRRLMAWEASPLIVDGSRESVRLVAALPSEWTTDGERLVMLTMACDAYERESAPGLENLAAWTGLNRRSVGKILDRLLVPNANRPALLVKTNASKGRATSRYRLQLSPTAEVQPPPTAQDAT